MKEDEKAFFRTCIRYCTIQDVQNHSNRGVTPRTIIKMLSEFINYKRCWYLLEKWTNKGFYNYGVTMDLGWFEEEYFTGEYQEMYLEILEQAKARNIIFEELEDVEKKVKMALIGIDANTKIPINLDEIAKQINSRLNINVNESLEKTATQLKQEYENKYLGRWL